MILRLCTVWLIIFIQMAEIQYRNRSISQLVSELNHLGEPNVLLFPLKLTAVHEKDMPDVKRFKNSHGDQFFIPNNSQKKFPYAEITQNITTSQMESMQDLFMRGFNLSIMFCVPREQGKLTQLLSEVVKMMGDCVCSTVVFNQQTILDSVGGNKLTERDFENRLKYYKVQNINLIAFLDRIIRGQSKGGISLIKLRSLQSGTSSKNQLNLIIFPEEIFSPGLKNSDFLGVCKSQLTQIFNYIKLNPANKYQHFSKLVTKRLPVTNIIASLVLEQTATFVINWMNEGGPGQMHERLSFYDKMRELSVLLKKQQANPPIISDLPKQFHLSRHEKERSNRPQIKTAKTDRTPVAVFEQESELDYCRSFERKTHKYSINDVELFGQQEEESNEERSNLRQASNTPSPVTHFPTNSKATSKQLEIRRFDETMPRKPIIQTGLQNSQIALLKARHAAEISQYHSTIQSLNKKILVLTKEQGLEELYSIHQREIMLLELKIKELRNDLTTLCNSSDEKTCKSMVRKLNEEIKRLESKNSEQKVSNSKVITLQKQLSELRIKYEESEKARKKLTFELENLTKRLKICDNQIQALNNQVNTKHFEGKHNNQNEASQHLSASDNQSLKQILILIKSVQQGNQQAKGFLVRKITNIMTDLSSCRGIILECNDFLVQLEEHLEQKLGNKEPQIVLDCNKFIRNFLMDNLSIF